MKQYDQKGNYTVVFTYLHFSHCFALSSLSLCVVLKLFISKTNTFGLRYNLPVMSREFFQLMEFSFTYYKTAYLPIYSDHFCFVTGSE